jgi:hypothetical protein
MPLPKHEYNHIHPLLEEKDTEAPYSEPESEDAPFLQAREPLELSKLTTTVPWILCITFGIASCILSVFLFSARRELHYQNQIIQQNEFSECAS